MRILTPRTRLPHGPASILHWNHWWNPISIRGHQQGSRDHDEFVATMAGERCADIDDEHGEEKRDDGQDDHQHECDQVLDKFL
jgi:hypothetical protein